MMYAATVTTMSHATTLCDLWKEGNIHPYLDEDTIEYIQENISAIVRTHSCDGSSDLKSTRVIIENIQEWEFDFAYDICDKLGESKVLARVGTPPERCKVE